MPVDERGLGTVHRLEAEDLLVHLETEHVLRVVLPVPRLLPEPLVDEDGRRDLQVPPGVLHLPRVALELPEHHHALGQPEGRARRDVVEGEELQLPPELPVVAALGLLEAPDVAVELLLGEPGRSVDALEHRPALVAPPVGARGRQELERLDVAGRRHVGPAAEVDEVALPVEGHAGHVRRQRLQDLDLERLVPLPVVADRLLAGPLLADDRVVRLGEVAHPLLEAAEVLLGEGHVAMEVVVEAVLDGGPDGELHPREQLGHRLGQEVGRRVPERGQGLGRAVVLARPRQMRVCLVRHSVCRIAPLDPPGPQDKNITKVTLRDALGAASLGVAHVVRRDTPRAMSYVVGTGGFEPPTSCASDRRSPTELRPWSRNAQNSVPTAHSGCQAPAAHGPLRGSSG